MTDALIMAGGRSERMRATAGPTHKALVSVLGVPMLERNLCALLASGFRQIAVVGNSREPAIADFVRTRGRSLADALEADIEYVGETRPLGTIGIAHRFRYTSDALLIVNADNLTTLDLQGLVAHHRQTGAALTIASHFEPFRIPFGELVVSEGRITQYLEKPVKPLRVSSGTYVLGPAACGRTHPEGRTDLPQLATELIGAGERVVAYDHDAVWIDVNDSAAVDRAEQLILENHTAFEHWNGPPDREVVDVVLRSAGRVLLEQADASEFGRCDQWRLPREALTSADADPLAAARRILHRFGLNSAEAPRLLTSFDQLDAKTGHITRHHVFFMEPVAASARQGGPESTWVYPEQSLAHLEFDYATGRSLAISKVCYGTTLADSLRPATAALRRA